MTLKTEKRSKRCLKTEKRSIFSVSHFQLEKRELGEHGLANFESAGVVIFYHLFVANVEDLPRVTALKNNLNSPSPASPTSTRSGSIPLVPL